eukprot:9504024-Pyramimonas_sp.AAC.1
MESYPRTSTRAWWIYQRHCSAGLKRTREAEQEAYRRCKTARQTDLRVMLAGPKGRAVGESGEVDTG